MEKDGGLSKGEREMIVVATSAANRCPYCVIAHGALMRIYTKSAMLADQVAVNYRQADLSDRQKAILDFALKVCQGSDDIDLQDFKRLQAHGLTEEDVWDVGAISAFFGLSNRMASLTGMWPNEQFYLMGRIPRPVTD
jgi:uncharacterized peroxidase-related enzyme